MARGFPKTPTAVLAARGSWRANARQHEPKYEVKVPVAPKWVDKKGRTFFRRLAGKMAGAGVMTDADTLALGLLTNCFVMYKEANDILEREGVTLTGTNKLGEPYTIQHPCVHIMLSTWDRIVKMCCQFGLTPASRASIQVGINSGKETAESDESRFFNVGT
jgi:P27 family predicted phage terminase small subunit